MQSGDYYISVLTDTYDVILEDSLTSNINPDDATHSDNSNYKSRPIGIIGAIPAPVAVPDLSVTEVTALAATDSGGNYSFSYTVQNLGDAMSRCRWGCWQVRPIPRRCRCCKSPAP